jgi:hypothetical protein
VVVVCLNTFSFMWKTNEIDTTLTSACNMHHEVDINDPVYITQNTKTSRLMKFKKIICICYGNHAKPINTPSEQN